MNMTTTRGKDLRSEFDNLVLGADGKPRTGYWHIIRHLRREASGKPIKCVCFNELSQDADPQCAYCFGEGYLWDEKWYLGRSQFVGTQGGLVNKYRSAPPGEVIADYKMFFFRYNVPILPRDKIVEVKLDKEGKVVMPYVRTAIYGAETINELRSDNGRVEFITVYCLEKDAIRPNYL